MVKHDNRGSLDFGTMNISYLFRKMLIPTFLGMVCSSLVNITDGSFAGRGVGSDALASLFLEPGTNANAIATAGLPFFSIGFLFTTLNLVQTGYYQSLERAGKASLVMLLRGFVFMLPVFFLLPHLVGTKGLWLAIPVTDFLTTITTLFLPIKIPYLCSYET